MAQGFQFGTPVTNADLLSSVVRSNFRALSTFHKGALPPSDPQDGFIWIDSSVSTNVQIKICSGAPPGHTWIVFMSHLESFPVFGDGSGFGFTIPFYEGSNPAPMINLDDYNFEDAAGFAPGVDQDIIFRIPKYDAFQNGINLRLQYCVSMASVQDIVLFLNYRVKRLGDTVNSGTDYNSGNVLLAPAGSADQIEFAQLFQIPGAHIPSDTERINLRLTRKGTDLLDTNPGQFCLMSVRVDAQ